jgi:hypothetical protein
MNATHMADNLATYALFSGNGLNQTEMDTLSSMPQDLCGSDASNWYEGRGKVWSREHNKNPGAGAGMEVEMLAGHARALKQEEVL